MGAIFSAPSRPAPAPVAAAPVAAAPVVAAASAQDIQKRRTAAQDRTLSETTDDLGAGGKAAKTLLGY